MSRFGYLSMLPERQSDNPVETARLSVVALHEAMTKLPQVVPDTWHYFTDGMYCRVVMQAAGILVVGKQHKRGHFYMVVSGAIAIIQEGAERRIYLPPSVIVSQPSTKRALLALEDTVYLTVHRTDKTDLDEIEKELIEEDPLSLFDARNQLKELL